MIINLINSFQYDSIGVSGLSSINNKECSDEKMPKIKVNIYSEFPLTFYGGGERLIIKIYNFLKENYVETKIKENSRIIREKRIKIESLDLENDLKSIKFHRYGLPKFLYQDMPSLEELSNSNADINLIFIRRFPPRNILMSLSKSNKKFVFCLHGISLEKFRFTDVRIIIHQIFLRYQMRYFSPFIKKNIYVQSLTPLISNYLQKKGGEKRNIFVVENEFKCDETSIAKNNEFFQVIFVGRIHNLTKGIKFLSKVISRVHKIENSIKFVVVGKGEDLKFLDKISKEIVLLDNADDEQKNRFIKSSNLAIITSQLDPMPRVTQEFLTAGIPIVTTPTMGQLYVINKNRIFGKASEFNSKKFSNDIIDFYYEWRKDKEYYYTRRKELSDIALKTFNENNMLKNYLNMILDISQRELL